MNIYEVTINFTEQGVIRFAAESEEDVKKQIAEKLPPLPDLTITSIVLIGPVPEAVPSVLN